MKASATPSEPSTSIGRTDDEQAAREAFEVGRRLAREGKYDEACAQFEKSIALSDGVGTLYNLADCEEHRGRFARAQTLFTRVAERSRLLDQIERERAARERAMALNGSVSLLQIEFRGAPAALTLDGEPIGRDAAGAVPIDPGAHQLSASAKGKRPWSKDLRVPRSGLLLLVTVPALADAAPRSEPLSQLKKKRSKIQRAPGKQTPRRVPAEARGSVAADAFAVGLLAAGAGGVVAGTAFGLRYLSKHSDAKNTCPTSERCTSAEVVAHQQLVDEAKKTRTYSYIGFGSGAAALAGAAVLHFTVGRDHGVEASTGMNSDGSFRAVLRGRF